MTCYGVFTTGNRDATITPQFSMACYGVAKEGCRDVPISHEFAIRSFRHYEERGRQADKRSNNV